MKTSLDCLPCFLNQALRVARLQGCSEAQQQQVVSAVAAMLPGLDLHATPPANAISVYSKIAALTGCADPYLAVKREENTRALQHLPSLREELQAVPEPLAAAIGFAIAGNVIDYGAAGRFDVEEAFRRSRQMNFAIDHRREMLRVIHQLRPGATVLYLTDNCGEIIYDSLVIELLARRGLQVTVAVKSGPIINDALLEDAETAGLSAFAGIITNGTACPGTPLQHCSEEFCRRFAQADLVISKGQGNFETLSEVDRELFFLLTVKCKMVGKHLAELSGSDSALTGNGEMIVYHSRKKED